MTRNLRRVGAGSWSDCCVVLDPIAYLAPARIGAVQNAPQQQCIALGGGPRGRRAGAGDRSGSRGGVVVEVVQVIIVVALVVVIVVVLLFEVVGRGWRHGLRLSVIRFLLLMGVPASQFKTKMEYMTQALTHTTHTGSGHCSDQWVISAFDVRRISQSTSHSASRPSYHAREERCQAGDECRVVVGPREGRGRSDLERAQTGP